MSQFFCQIGKAALILLLHFSFVLSGCSAKNGRPEKVSDNAVYPASSGKIVRIVDGDTYYILINGQQTKVRMFGIDAPEKGMDYYKMAKDYLGQLCYGKIIRMEEQYKDGFGRIVARSYLPDGRDIAAELLKAGMVWHFKKYSNDTGYASLEVIARNNKTGLWSLPNPTPPWEFRIEKRRQTN